MSTFLSKSSISTSWCIIILYPASSVRTYSKKSFCLITVHTQRRSADALNHISPPAAAASNASRNTLLYALVFFLPEKYAAFLSMYAATGLCSGSAKASLSSISIVSPRFSSAQPYFCSSASSPVFELQQMIASEIFKKRLELFLNDGVLAPLSHLLRYDESYPSSFAR